MLRSYQISKNRNSTQDCQVLKKPRFLESPLVRGMDPDPTSDPDPSIIKQKK